MIDKLVGQPLFQNDLAYLKLMRGTCRDELFGDDGIMLHQSLLKHRFAKVRITLRPYKSLDHRPMQTSFRRKCKYRT
jgi:hypothetical protein